MNLAKTTGALGPFLAQRRQTRNGPLQSSLRLSQKRAEGTGAIAGGRFRGRRERLGIECPEPIDDIDDVAFGWRSASRRVHVSPLQHSQASGVGYDIGTPPLNARSHRHRLPENLGSARTPFGKRHRLARVGVADRDWRGMPLAHWAIYASKAHNDLHRQSPTSQLMP